MRSSPSVATSSLLVLFRSVDGCGGIREGTGTGQEGGDSFSGRARVNDSCGVYLAGMFTMRR